MKDSNTKVILFILLTSILFVGGCFSKSSKYNYSNSKKILCGEPENGLQACASVPKKNFIFGEQVEITLELHNLSNKSIRIIKPVILVEGDPRSTLGLKIFRNRNTEITRNINVFINNLITPPHISYSTVIKAKRTFFIKIKLYNDKRNMRKVPWTYIGGKISWIYRNKEGKNIFYEDYLPVGKYNLSLWYHFLEGTDGSLWSMNLSKKYSRPWHGELFSNEIHFTILPKHK